MGAKSAIEWTDSTWNPIRARNLAIGKIGWHCEHVSEGCRNCYAESINERLGTGLDFKPGHRANLEIFLDEQMLLAPLRWKKPRMIFVNSMTDTFAEIVKDEWIDRMFAVMALAPQHTFQVLTKRAGRMREYMAAPDLYARLHVAVHALANYDDPGQAFRASLFIGHLKYSIGKYWLLPGHLKYSIGKYWPLPNVWLGVSAERQQEADERIPDLLATPAQIRFLSLEPLLGPIHLTRMKFGGGWYDVLGGWRDVKERFSGFDEQIDWVIAGGESGPHARPTHPDWFRSLRDQCAAAAVPFFFKQWGEFAANPEAPDGYWASAGIFDDHPVHNGWCWGNSGGRKPVLMPRLGKKAAGRLLDGIEHNGMPGAPS